MSLSFEDSLKKAQEEALMQAESVTSNNVETTSVEVQNASVMALDYNVATDENIAIAAYSGDDGSWMQHTGYDWYDGVDGRSGSLGYDDDSMSNVDEMKNVSLNSKQFNITQEHKSQFIPFEMPRYYDGYDLTQATICINYRRKDGKTRAKKAVNVRYNNDKIQFGWLVEAHATEVVGKLEFEIVAFGADYIWKSRLVDKMNVLDSIPWDEELVSISSDDTWVSEIVEAVTEQIVGMEFNEQLANAESAATRAETAAVNAESAATNAVSTALNNYSTTSEMESYVSQQIENADIEGKLTEYAKTSEVETLIGTIGESENVADYINTSLEPYATKEDVESAIENADIEGKLTEYYKKSETYSRKEIDTALDNVSVDLTGYATEKYVDDKTSALSSSISTNTENISSLSTTVGNLQNTVNSIDTSPRLTYDVAYNDTEDADVGENVFVFYEIENEGKENEVKEAKKKFTIVGGSGGGATSSSLKIGYVTTSPLVVTTNDSAIIKYTFSGTDSSGDDVPEGAATWKVAGRIVATNTALNGENSFDVTEYLSIGTQKVNLSIVDEAGSLVTKTWTVQKIDIRLESTFNDKLTYPIGTVSFDYTPYGAISKDVHFVLDGVEIGKVTTTSSGIPMAYEIPVQEHGAHLLEAYITAEVNGNAIESNYIVKDIIWYDSTSNIPVIATTYQAFTARQYDATNIEYTVYDPSTETPTVKIAVDGNVVSTPTLDEATNVYSFKTDIVGEHTITITCGETIKTLIATITELDIDISPVTAGLVFDFNPSGKSNNDADRIWSTDTVAMTVSDNFDWINGGYQYDENGDQYFCIKAGTSAEIDYQLFADDAKKNGKEMKLVFKTANVAKPDATFLSCIDNTIGTDHIGIQMDVHEASIYGQAGSLQLPYSEEDIIEFEFNISKNTEDIPMVMGYEDGVSTRPMVYDDSYNFTQNSPKIISLGSEDCDLHIYRFKVYNTSLTAKGILNNFIADARNAEEMISRYERNDIYDENQNLDPDVLAEKCPWLRVYKLSAPYFTNNKSDKVPNTTIQQIYKNGDPVLDNWTCYDCSHSGQGTSSNNYGAAGRNLDFIMNKSQIEGVKPYFILGDGTKTDKITLTRTSVPVAYLNAKVNIASSNNMTNAMLANRYNEFEPYSRPFIRTASLLDVYSDEEIAAMTEEEQASALAELQAKVDSEISYIKDTMFFQNCVIFIQETNEDLSTHREFEDKDWHFYAIGNIGDSKKTDSTRLTDIDDKYECCVEIMDVELPLSDFPVDTMMNAMGYTEDETTHEKKYTWATDDNLGILYELIDGEYVLTEDTTVDLTKTYYVDILEHDDFSEDYTYGWRYIYEDGTDEENAEVFDYCKQKWIEAYRFITTSTDEEFKAGIGNYFVLDTVLYYYLFTTRYCMIDNRAKNSFWHYGKTGELDSDGNPIRKWDLTWMYDCDSSLGLNNYGAQVYRYGLEDTDVDEKGIEVFRESDSTFFCRIRDLFSTELKTMYNTLESKNAWHAESFINKADEWQSEFPEELWRVDIERKYIRTYNGSFINGKGDSQFLVNMSNGKMKYHRRQWERNQEKYMASKYQSSVASSDNSVFRCEVPTGNLVVEPNYRLKLTPYAYMYLNVKYGTQNPIQLRAEPNITYEIPFEGDKADIVDIYSSSLIQDFGDLSSCYVATADTSKASKVKKLIFGNDIEGYDNPNFTTLTTGANYLLEVLNIENVSGLTQSLNLTALNNLRELYAHGSNIGGVTFADGGRIEIAELPAINAISMKNLIYLTTLDITDFSKLTTLTVENCSTVDLLTILNSAANINRVRIVGIDWILEDTTLLERLYTMKGIDKSGYNADQSVLTGKVHVPVIRQQQLVDYQKVWSDLEIIADTIIEQFAVTFMNANGNVLEVQYVDKGEYAVDPTTREDNPISPTIESTVSHDFIFDRWDTDISTLQIFTTKTVTAIYTESLRQYQIKYVSMGTTLAGYPKTGYYGENVLYDGDIPTYTLQEGGFKYYLFNRWDKSGFLDGDFDANGVKTVNAIFDEFVYTDTNVFNGKELKDLSPVEIYALTKLTEPVDKELSDYGMSIETGDDYSFTMGYDIDYDDIESVELISENTVYDGTNYTDTGITLFDVDKDFVLAIDYKILSGNSTGATLMQCYQTAGTNGFKLSYESSPVLSWGGTTISTNNTTVSPSAVNNREMLVIRHKSGDNNLYIYTSNLSSDNIKTYTIARDSLTQSDTATLIFGAAKLDSGRISNYGIGEINWCKIWYKDLGEDICNNLVSWIHEKITLETSGFYRYQLYDDTSKESMMSLLATHLLSVNGQYNTSSNKNTGGWGISKLNEFLNGRFYNAIPYQIKALIKKVSVKFTIGDNSTAVSSSGCFINIPALYDVYDDASSEYREELYEAASTIDFFTGLTSTTEKTNRVRYLDDYRLHSDGDEGIQYWLRSPSINTSWTTQRYCYSIKSNGDTQSVTSTNSNLGILIEISF